MPPPQPPRPPTLHRIRRRAAVRGTNNNLADALSRQHFDVDSLYYIDDVAHHVRQLPSTADHHYRSAREWRRPRRSSDEGLERVD